jgi:hypothetical protein
MAREGDRRPATKGAMCWLDSRAESIRWRDRGSKGRWQVRSCAALMSRKMATKVAVNRALVMGYEGARGG